MARRRSWPSYRMRRIHFRGDHSRLTVTMTTAGMEQAVATLCEEPFLLHHPPSLFSPVVYLFLFPSFLLFLPHPFALLLLVFSNARAHTHTRAQARTHKKMQWCRERGSRKGGQQTQRGEGLARVRGWGRDGEGEERACRMERTSRNHSQSSTVFW